MLASLLTLFIIGLVGLVALSVVLTIAGAAFGLALAFIGFLLFKVLPIVLVGYVLVRLLRPRTARLSAADREWLES